MKKKFRNLVEKEGFILFLFVCVCIVAGGTIFISTRDLYSGEKKDIEENLVILDSEVSSQPYLDELDPSEYLEGKETLDEEIEVEMEDITVLAEAGEDYEDEYEEEEEVELEFIEEEADDVESVSSTRSSIDFILPVEGPIITEYTKDSLIYSETLEAWIGHQAIDIGAKEGTPVLASMDGVVEEVYEDDLWGIVIVIDHGNRIKTKYANLATKEMVKVGTNVRKGDHISKVGKTAKIEMLMEAHLHFEVIKDGELVDLRSIKD